MDPINCCNFNKIENHIYLGDKHTACNLEFLEKYNIKRVLTLRQLPIVHDLKVDGIIYKSISVRDHILEDLLSYFPECFNFISDAQKNGENVYIHCHAGVSRSTTVVIAFLMKKYGLSARKTIENVSLKRECTKPNNGFRYQLKLWEKMLYQLNGSNQEYRRFLLTALRNHIEVKVFKLISHQDWDLCLETYVKTFENYFLKLSVAESNVDSLNRGMSYRCNCGNQLFNELDVIKSENISTVCQSVYIEPQKWIFDAIVKNAKAIADLMAGDIECSYCKEKLGSYDWRRTAYFCKCKSHQGLNKYSIVKIFAHKLNN